VGFDFSSTRFGRRRFFALGSVASGVPALLGSKASAEDVNASVDLHASVVEDASVVVDVNVPPAPLPALGPYLARPSAHGMSVWFESDQGAPGIAEARDLSSRHRTVAPFSEIDRGLFLATFTDLRPDTGYSYRFVDAKSRVHTSTFRTFPTERSIAKVVFGSDIHPWSAPHSIFDRIADEAPHLYVGIGDQVYADVDVDTIPAATPEAYAALYRRTWNDPSIARCFRKVPAALVWDDHEIWNDYDGTTNQDRFLAARVAYRRYQRSRSRGSTPWSVVRVGAAEIFLADTRSHRDPNYANDVPGKSILGTPQREALMNFIATSTAGLRIVASPTPFHRYVTTGRDGWALGFAGERELLLRHIDAHDPRTVLLVSGDQHWPGVFSHALPSGGHVIELQCTPTSAFFRAKPTEVGPDVWYVDGDHTGYGSLVIDGTGPEPRARFAWTDSDGRERYVLEHPTMPRAPTTELEAVTPDPA